MKLVRFGPHGREKAEIVDSKGVFATSRRWCPISRGTLSPKGLAKIRKAPIEKLPLVRGSPRLAACVGGVGNLIAIGLNYSDHAAEAGMAIPKEPIIFNKVSSCICGPNDDTIIPKGSTKLDWEVELHRHRPARALPVQRQGSGRGRRILPGQRRVGARSSRSSSAGQWVRARAARRSGRSALGW
jgi:hypothetical protein